MLENVFTFKRFKSEIPTISGNGVVRGFCEKSRCESTTEKVLLLFLSVQKCSERQKQFLKTKFLGSRLCDVTVLGQ